MSWSMKGTKSSASLQQQEHHVSTYAEGSTLVCRRVVNAMIHEGDQVFGKPNSGNRTMSARM